MRYRLRAMLATSKHAEAILIVEGLTWLGEGMGLVRFTGLTSSRVQILVGTLMFHIATYNVKAVRRA